MTQRYPAHATDLIPCWTKNTLTVFRVPGSRTFDRELRTVAAQQHITINVIDTKYSRATLFATMDEVGTRRAALARCGATWRGDSPGPGYVQVDVAGHPTCARKVLADLGDRIRVVVDTRPPAFPV